MIATLLDALSKGQGQTLFQGQTSVRFRMRLNLDGFILVLSFEIFCQTLLNLQTSQVLKIPQISFYQAIGFLQSYCPSLPIFFLYFLSDIVFGFL